MKATLVIGASENQARYSNTAANRLVEYQENVILFGKRNGQIEGITIETDWNPDWKVDTITLYLNPQNQLAFYDKIIALKPKRVIFNPGTENSELAEKLRQNGIASENSCTLVLLSVGKY